MMWAFERADSALGPPFNPLTPKSDEYITSPDNIHSLSNKQVMRILKLFR